MKKRQTQKQVLANSEQEKEVVFLDRRTLARRWRYSTETLKRMERMGTLPSLRIGRVALYRVTDILRIEQEAEVAR